MNTHDDDASRTPPASGEPSHVPQPAPPPAPAPKKRKRRFPIWLRVIVGIFLFLVLLVIFAPTIASTGVVRSYVLSKVNDNLNGKVEISSWSLGWTGGVKATGVRVLDASGQPVVEVGEFSTGLSLIGAIRGNYVLGDVVVDGLNFNVKREADGELNVAKLAKKSQEPSKPAHEPTEKPDKTKSASKLPDVSGHFIVRNSKGTYEDVVKKQIVRFDAIDGDVKVPNINAPIENALKVVAVAGNGQPGTLNVNGTVDVVENNELQIEKANVDEKIGVDNLAMPAVAAMMPPGSIDRLDGLTNATVSLKMTAGQSGVLQANIVTTNLAAGGPALKGDTFTSRELSIVIPPTTIDMSPGFGTWQNWPIRMAKPLAVTIKHDGYDDVATLGVNATPQALINFAANLKPGSAGNVDADVRLDVGKLAKQLPHSFPEQQGKRLSAGKLEETTRIKLAANSADVSQSLQLTNLALASVEGKSEQLQPIQQELRFTSHGGGWKMPDLRDIDLALTSGFAQAKFGGKELAQLKGTATGDLAKAQRELGQILPAMQGMQLGGTFKVDLTTTGDVTSNTAPLDLRLIASVAGLQLDGVGGLERFQQGHSLLDASAKVVRDASGAVDALNGVRVVAQTGKSERDLTVDSQFTADVKFVQSTQNGQPARVAQVPRYSLDKLDVNLPAAQRDFPKQLASLTEQGVRIDAGTFALTASGSYTPEATTFDAKGGINGLTLTRDATPVASASATLAPTPPAAARTTVLRDYTLKLDAAGALSNAGTRVTRLNVDDGEQKMLSLHKGNGDIVIPAATRNESPSGEVVLAADVKKVLDVSRAMGADAGKPQDTQLTSGRLDGTLKLAQASGAEKLVALTGRLDATQLSVKTAGQPIRDEKIVVVPSVRFTPDFGVVNVDEVKIDGRLVNGRIFDTVIDNNAAKAKDAPPLAIVQKANATFSAPALGDLHALILAINPPAPTTQPSGKPAPVGRILGGNANVNLTLAHQGGEVVITPAISAKGLIVGAGDVSKNVGDVTVNTAVHMVSSTAKQPDNATLMQRLAELNIPTMAIAGAGAKLDLDKPLVVKELASNSPSVSAVLKGNVNLKELLTTLEAWNGAKPGTMYPYAGDMQLTQQFATTAGVVSMQGRADVNNFSTTDANGKTAFAEKHIAFANDLNVDQNAKVLTLKNVALATESSNAMRLSASGTIRDYDTTRTFDDKDVVAINLNYQAKPLWDLLRPIMDPETGGKSLEEFTLAGNAQRRIEVRGSYPAKDPNPVRFLNVNGGFALDTLAGRGLTVSNLDLKFLLDKGILKLQHANAAAPSTAPSPPSGAVLASAKPPPPGAACNGGVISFHDFTVDLTGEHPRLTTPDNHPLIRGASVNAVVANTILGRFVNPAFSGSDQAKGLLDVMVVSCRNLAVDKSMQLPRESETGRAEIRWSLTDLFIGQPELVGAVNQIAGKLGKGNSLSQNGFSGNIKDGRVVIAGGKAQSDMTFNLDRYDVGFNGGIGLAENKLIGFNMRLPQSLFAAIDPSLARSVPKQGYNVALSGTTDNWLNNATQSMLPIIADLGVRAGIDSALGRALGGNKKNDRKAAPDGAAAPEPRQADNPLDQLLNNLGGKKDKDADTKKSRSEKSRASQQFPRTAEDKPAAASTQPTTQPADTKPAKKKKSKR
jgi:hypothetical protein